MSWLNMPEHDLALLKKMVLRVGIVVAIVGVLMAYFSIRDSRREDRLAPWTARIADYMPADKVAAVRDARANGMQKVAAADPRVKRYLLPIDLKASRVDNLYFEMPAGLRSSTPEDVQTIVWLDWAEEVVDKYTDGTPARVYICHVTVLDSATFRVIAQRTFRGTEPPQEIRKDSNWQGIGERPTLPILQYLSSMAGNW
jgi:hypothetical protein